MRQDVLPVVYCQLRIDWQLVQIFEYLLSNSLLYMLQVVVRDLASIPIVDMIGILDFRYSYRVSGEVDVANRVAYFSMKTLKRNER